MAEIDCGSFVLRPLVQSDAEALATHANDRDVWINLRDRFPHPYSLSDAEQYIATTAEKVLQTSFGIVVEGEAAGTIGLIPGTDIERCTAELGYWIGRAFWGRGIMRQAIEAVTSYGFASLGFNRIFAVPMVRNVASARVLEKAGYVREALMRRGAVKEGEIVDLLLYAAYDDRWTPRSRGF
jgi:[ribosomal protein S5]-alanine N-acetyltransferase